MRFMVIVKASQNSEAGILPSQKLLADLGKFNEELSHAGVMLAGEGLQPGSKGVRVKFSDGRRTLIDGPFAETREQLGGYFMVEASDLNEAIRIAARIPGARKGTIEVRPVLEIQGLPTKAYAENYPISLVR